MTLPISSTAALRAAKTQLADLADAAMGDRIRASIDRRIRVQLTQVAAAWQRAEQERTSSPAQSNRDFTADIFFGARRRSDRTLNPQRYARLAQEICGLAGIDDADLSLQQAFRGLIDAETTGLGRIAGSTYNIMGKLVLPPLLDAPRGAILEIGTLYGMFSPVLVRQFRRRGDFRRLTVIDPLAGSQVQPGSANGPDSTGTPVVAEIARHNLLAGGLDPDDITIIQGYSWDAAARAKAEGDRYAVIIVDGDHSEEGVYQDLRWLESVALPGAIVVMDDYGDRTWPGVERAGQRYLSDGGCMQFLGTAATSAYLRMPRKS